MVALTDFGGAIVARYTYDAWGKLLTVTDGAGNDVSSNTAHIANVNPIRYRSYVYDTESGFYYLTSRYYDPAVGRFISADAYASTGQGYLGHNMFAYCGNNPVSREEVGGCFWETAFDIVSLCSSIVDVCINPTDPWAWAGLVGDVVDLAVPVVAGVGESIRLAKAAATAADVVDAVHDTAKAADNIGDLIDTASDVTASVADTIEYTEKVRRQMENVDDLYHAFPTIIDTVADLTTAKPIVGNDKVVRQLIIIPGAINGIPGVFEYIIDANGRCNHRLFKPFY